MSQPQRQRIRLSTELERAACEFETRRRLLRTRTTYADSILRLVFNSDMSNIGFDIAVEVGGPLKLVQQLALDGIGVDEPVQGFMFGDNALTIGFNFCDRKTEIKQLRDVVGKKAGKISACGIR